MAETKDINQKNSMQAEDESRQWFAVHTYSGYEDAVERYLKQRIESLGVNDRIFNVIVPKEKKVKIKNGKRSEVEEKIYPGYVLVEMIMSPDTWYIVRNTPRVTGFVGADSTTPSPLSKEEVDSLMMKMKGEEPSFKVDFRIGELVRIVDGPFKDSDGKIDEIDEAKGRVKVLVPIFGRDTAVELDALQIQKI
ncbi:MAG: transcription termination/antitermination protein NusG [Candidatus Colwellbacteria bacterium]|jgi:transcriptional antiterminator NusG|nr:transcription termination/antitermination protein NusG [Candidatus Colwellbacteria bacterium]MCK9497291.1 transcription termination/antitermination protein NusG [Candidatus Colwellbacteria bacterium]MDD3752776.1 transcription termination/antitermination protein NusG [Candidatus Colwellbacteria bacterium]MDD4818763.1 transcription termination/antitermination protein NusG [Candidatus Colwellbacteria bacterium]